jgi:tetratricopeptide (TPR) repeat protein
MSTAACALVVVLVLTGAAPPARAAEPQPEVVSPLGAKFYPRVDEKNAVAEAEKNLAADPTNVDRLVALGRAQVSVLRLREAIATFTRAIELQPGNARLYRLRGHRYISSRQFDRAVADLERAAKLSDKEFDIWYHLGLAHYLKRDYARAAEAYTKARDCGTKDDNVIAASNWLYASYRRQKKTAEAGRVLERITPDMNVQEDKMYFALLLFYKGLKQESEVFHGQLNDMETATVGYGIGNWHLYNGRAAKAKEVFGRIVAGKEWAAFGFISAEAELARRPRGDQPLRTAAPARVE